MSSGLSGWVVGAAAVEKSDPSVLHLATNPPRIIRIGLLRIEADVPGSLKYALQRRQVFFIYASEMPETATGPRAVTRPWTRPGQGD